jgi:FkbM family methyltransferase
VTATKGAKLDGSGTMPLTGALDRPALRPPFVARALTALVGSRIRGTTRGSLLLGRWLPGIRMFPAAVPGGRLWIDLRHFSAYSILLGSSPAISEQRLLARVLRPGDVCYDIGGHFGTHAVMMSALTGPGGRVFVFEPNHELHACLGKTVRGLGNARLYELGLSDKPMSAPLTVPIDSSMAHVAVGTSAPTARVCRFVTLDGLVASGELPRPDFVKCDVEGFEESVFKGARQALDHERAPFVLFEANAEAAAAVGSRLDAAMELLTSLPRPRYRVYRLLPTGELGSSTPLLPYCDLFAVPADRAERLSDVPSEHTAR